MRICVPVVASASVLFAPLAPPATAVIDEEEEEEEVGFAVAAGEDAVDDDANDDADVDAGICINMYRYV